MRNLLVAFQAIVIGLGGAPAEDPVLRWNELALEAVAADHAGPFEQGGPTRTARALAIVHAAIYDAWLTAEPKLDDAAARGLAVGAAARGALAALYPSQEDAFTDALLDAALAVDSPALRREALRLGARAASRVLHERARDGSENEMEWTPSDEPGHHREDPLNPDQGFLTPGWGDVRPFVLKRGDALRPPPPPALGSAEYAEALEEVRGLGGDGLGTPTERSVEQTEIGLYWGYDGAPGLGTPPRLYNQIAREIAEQRANDTGENARLFLLVNLAMADAGIACWEAKYHYDVWRPVLGVREDASDPDPGWTPLGAPASNDSGIDFTPPFPAYPSGHATFGAALFRILERFYGTDEIAFEFTSDELNGVTTDSAGMVRPLSPRSFEKLSDATWENAVSRIYLGIHWSFDATEGIVLGERIADQVFERALTRSGKRR